MDTQQHSKEMTKEEFFAEFQNMKLELAEIKEFMANIMKAVEPEKPDGKKKDEGFFSGLFGSD